MCWKVFVVLPVDFVTGEGCHSLMKKVQNLLNVYHCS
jgi:hypothetical protein